MLRQEAQIAHENNEFNPLSQVFNMILFREKVKLPARKRGAFVAKPSGTAPKPPAVAKLWRGKPVFARRAKPRSPVAILSGEAFGEGE